MFFHLGHIHVFLSRCTCYKVRGWALGVQQGGATHFSVLWCCMWGRGPRGNNAACSALGFQSLPPLPTSKLGPFGGDSWVGGFVYILGPCGSLQWTLLCDWEFLLLLQPTQVFKTRGFEAFFFTLGPWVAWPVLLPSYSSQFIYKQMWDHLVSQPPPCLPGPPATALLHLLSAPAVCLCSSYQSGWMFNSLVVGVPCSLIFWQFWLFIVFKLIVILLLVVWGSETFLSMPPSWLELSEYTLLIR